MLNFFNKLNVGTIVFYTRTSLIPIAYPRQYIKEDEESKQYLDISISDVLATPHLYADSEYWSTLCYEI